MKFRTRSPGTEFWTWDFGRGSGREFSGGDSAREIFDLGQWIGERWRGRGGGGKPRSHEPWHQGLWIRLAANPNRSARVAHLRSMSPWLVAPGPRTSTTQTPRSVIPAGRSQSTRIPRTQHIGPPHDISITPPGVQLECRVVGRCSAGSSCCGLGMIYRMRLGGGGAGWRCRGTRFWS